METIINKKQCRYCYYNRHYTNIENLKTDYFCCKGFPIEKVDPDDYCENFEDKTSKIRNALDNL